MKKLKRKNLLILLVILCLVGSYIYAFNPERPMTIHLGIYSGSSWDVPNARSYDVIDLAIKKFCQIHPNVTVTYESGVLKSDYSSWLSDKIIEGKQPDVFIVPEKDFNILSSTGAMANLNRLVPQYSKIASGFYESCLEAGRFGDVQYALPYESNIRMMCVNTTLLKKYKINPPKNGWSVTDFYQICKRVTRDLNNDGVPGIYGATDYTWRDAISAYGISLFNKAGTKAYFNSEEVKEALSFTTKIQDLSHPYDVKANDFDEGKVAFIPMTLAQYRTYRPYPYRVAKYSTFDWNCIEMPAGDAEQATTDVETSLFAMSPRTNHPELAWEFMQMLCCDEEVQQYLVETSQGISVLKKVMNSKKTEKIVNEDAMNDNALTVETIDFILNKATPLPKFKKYTSAMDVADHLITESIDNDSIELDLADIQTNVENQLK